MNYQGLTNQLRPLVKSLTQLAYTLKSNDAGKDEPIDPEVVAELLYGIYGDDAIEKIGQILEKRKTVTKAWSESDHPRDPKTKRFIPKGSGEAKTAATDAVRKVLRGDHSVSPKEIADHLSILTMKQIRALAAEHGRKVPKVLKADLIESVKALVGKPAETKAEAKSEAPKAEGKSEAKAEPKQDVPEKRREELDSSKVSDTLTSASRWHTNYDLPKPPSESQMISDIQNSKSPHAYLKTIAMHGWATNGKYAVKASDKLIKAAKEAGAESMGGMPVNVEAFIPQKRGSSVKIVAAADGIGPGGADVLLLEDNHGVQQRVDAKYYAIVNKYFPDAEWAHHDNGLISARKDGEVVAIIMGLDGPIKAKDAHTNHTAKESIKDIAEPGPFSPKDAVEHFDGITMPGWPVRLRVTGSKDSGFSLMGGGLDFPKYKTVAEAKNAAREILSYAQGVDSNKHLIFSPVGSDRTELEGEQKAHKDYYESLRAKAKEKPVKVSTREFTDNKGERHTRELHHVGDHFAVHESIPDWRNKAGGYRVFHTGAEAHLPGEWKNKTDAIKAAHILQNMPDIDWTNFAAMAETDPDKFKELARKANDALKAFERDEYHPAMGGPIKLKK